MRVAAHLTDVRDLDKQEDESCSKLLSVAKYKIIHQTKIDERRM